jgi:GNAT superfamily N-acetyltransferase
MARRGRDFAYMDERHVWYVLDLDRVELLPLAEGYELRLAGDGDVDMVVAEQAGGTEMVRERRSEGVQLWLVQKGGETAFSCWIFPREQPVPAAASGVLEFPPGVACLEDSFTDAEHRGRGIAASAWTAIAQELARDGYKVLVTKVGVGNAPSRRACEKTGFRLASVMHFRRLGPRESVTFEPGADDLTPAEREAGDQLERSLTR